MLCCWQNSSNSALYWGPLSDLKRSGQPNVLKFQFCPPITSQLLLCYRPKVICETLYPVSTISNFCRRQISTLWFAYPFNSNVNPGRKSGSTEYLYFPSLSFREVGDSVEDGSGGVSKIWARRAGGWHPAACWSWGGGARVGGSDQGWGRHPGVGVSDNWIHIALLHLKKSLALTRQYIR